jgi:hypothetical protein
VQQRLARLGVVEGRLQVIAPDADNAAGGIDRDEANLAVIADQGRGRYGAAPASCVSRASPQPTLHESGSSAAGQRRGDSKRLFLLFCREACAVLQRGVCCGRHVANVAIP